jgi:hypothetical protein
MKNVWVNIWDFLQARNKVEVHQFRSEATLAAYTVRTGRVYPRKKIEKDSPLKLLLAHILYPRWYTGKVKKAAA